MDTNIGVARFAELEALMVPLERQQLSVELSGSKGLYRNPHKHLALIRADDDRAAIETWLDTVGSRSAATKRAYRKEAERLLAWAIVEQGKPMSSLNVEDMVAFERFLKNPLSRHPNINWIARKYQDPETGKESVRKYPRAHKEWRPFDGPLTPSSVEYSLQVLKSLFSYWTDVGYTLVNPLKVRRKSYKPNKDAVIDRVLNTDTWAFLYHFLETSEESIAVETPAKERLKLLRLANQRYMVFSALYFLGVRISELASIRMCDFARRQTISGEEQYWVKITGKGNKTRTIPVPMDLMGVLFNYRRTLNTFPVQKRRKADSERVELMVAPSLSDQTTMILSSSGNGSLSANAIYKIVKSALGDALANYEQLVAAGRAPKNVNPEQLAFASTHWMRHTSATHQSLKGVSLRYIKEFLGHASYDTTLIYDHVHNEQWVSEIRKFSK